MQHDVHKIYYRCLIAVIGVLILGLVYLRLKDEDVYGKSVTEPGYVTDQTAPNGDQILAEGCDVTYLYPGSYRLAIRAEVSGSDLYYQVCDKWSNRVLAEASYVEGESVHVVSFTTEEMCPNVVVRSLRSDAAEGSDDLTIEEYILESEGAVCTDALWSVGLMALVALLLYLGYRRYVCKGRPAFLAMTAASALVSMPFFTSNLQAGHDIYFHLTRIANIGMAMSGGYWPERLNTLTGGDSIIPIMYPEVLLTGAGFMVYAGATVTLAFKVLCACITFATACVAYYAVRQVVDEQPALLFAFLWLINPFRMNEIMVRAAMGEALAIIFLPLVAVGMWQMLHGSCRQGGVDLVLGYTGLMASHMLTLVIVAVFCALFVVGEFLLHPRRFLCEIRRIGWLILAAVATVLVNVYYLVPFLTYYQWDLYLSNGANSSWELQPGTTPLWQIFMNVVGYGDNLTTTDLQGEMAFSIGFALLAGICVWLVYWLHQRRIMEAMDGVSDTRRLENAMVWRALLWSLCAIFMVSRYFPWDWLIRHLRIFARTLGSIQHAWRLLMIPACLLSFLLAVLIHRLAREQSLVWRSLSVGLLVLAVVSGVQTATNYYYTNDTVYTDHFENIISYNIDYATTNAQEHDAAFRKWFGDGSGPQVSDHADAVVIEDYHRDGVGYVFVVSNTGSGDATVMVPVFWYGLHRAYLTDGADETELPTAMDEEYQLTNISIPAGVSHASVYLVYEEPTSFAISYIVSGIIAIALGLGLIISYRRAMR